MHGNEQGFTLLETVMAAAVLAIGIFTLYSMQVMSVRGNSIAASITQAANLNSLELERLLAAKFDEEPAPGQNKPGLRVEKSDRDECWLWDKDPEEAKNDAELCLGANSTWEEAQAALAAKDDHVFLSKDGNYLIAYNVAAHYPVVWTKTIRIHVFSNVRNGRDSGLKPTTFELIRNDPSREPESGTKRSYY